MSLSPQLPRTSPTHPVPESLFESEDDRCPPENGFRREGSRENCGVSLPEVTYWLCHSVAIEPSVIYLVSLNLNFHKCKIELFYHPYHGSVVHIKWNDKYIALRRKSGTENVQQMFTFILYSHDLSETLRSVFTVILVDTNVPNLSSVTFLLLLFYKDDTGASISIPSSLWTRFPGIVTGCTDSSTLSLTWLLLSPGLQRGRAVCLRLPWGGKEITVCPLEWSATQTFRDRETMS